MALPEILKVSFEFSPKLGIRELPRLDDDHQSNVRGLYVVGDLADAPIIKVALRQGYDVARTVAQRLAAPAGDDILDVVIVGAGPAGIGAALALQDTDLRCVVLERDRPFQTIQNFPRHKMIFAEPREFENPTNLWFGDASREDLLDRWEEALDDQTLPIRQPEEVESIEREGGMFTVRSQ
ncbi:MAG: NAD(P)-binding domain-containing protein, partial [Myxococcota bacterium]|nr:NAD(P)-binding domain-containing protein [Myxococcota bacterium]